MAKKQSAQGKARNGSRTPVPPLGRVAVIGAGLSGLAAAYRLHKEGLEVTVYEPCSQVGGKIQSHTSQGFQWDTGANSMTENEPEVGLILNELQLQSKVAVPVQQNKRYVVKNGQPALLPTTFSEFLSTPILSPTAKLRMLAEPLLWARRRQDVDPEEESVRSFLERHVGSEPVTYIVDPFCAGTFASDPDSLSMKYAFPDLWALEQEHGSLVVGAVKSQMAKAAARKKAAKEAQEPGEATQSGGLSGSGKRHMGSFSFTEGMQTLPFALARTLAPSSLQLNTAVVSLSCEKQHQPCPVWTVGYEPAPPSACDSFQPDTPLPAPKGGKGSSSRSREGRQERKVKAGSQRYDAVVVTTPLSRLRGIKLSCNGTPWDPSTLPLPLYQPMSLVVTAFPASAVTKPLPGFGVLIPSVEQHKSGFKTLGTLFSSSMFPDRAPPGFLLFTTFIGGRRGAHFAPLPPDELRQMALKDLGALLGVSGSPSFFRHFFWKEAFPEYGKTQGAVVRGIDKLEKEHPFLYYAGNHRDGLAVGRALLSGYRAAGRVVSDLKAHGGGHLFTMA